MHLLEGMTKFKVVIGRKRGAGIARKNENNSYHYNTTK